MDWSTFLSTFGLVFVAELGDKTQLAVVTQICKFRRPWAVFWGATLALVAVTAIGAVGGQVIGRLIPPLIVRAIAALGFVVMGLLIWREAAQKETEAACAAPEDAECAAVAPTQATRLAFTTTFGLLFFAELGDKTQLAVIGLAGKQPLPWSVFFGGALALTLVTALGVLFGQGLCALIPEKLLLKISAVAFVVLGVLMGIGVF